MTGPTSPRYCGAAREPTTRTKWVRDERAGDRRLENWPWRHPGSSIQSLTDLLEQLRQALVDRYTIEREFGRGGMATVYLARDLKHDRPVAIKVLRPDVAMRLGSERFLREIHLTSSLNHPNILPLYDSGDAEGQLYYVMPFVEGGSLRARLENERQLPMDVALRITREVGAGPRPCPAPRHHPPGHQAGKHPALRGTGRGRGLRHRTSPGQRRGDPPHGNRDGDRHAGIHVAGAGHRRAQHRRPQRRLCPGLRAVRDADRISTVHRRDGAGHHCAQALGAGSQAPHRARDGLARSRTGDRTGPGQGPGRPVFNEPGVRRRARAIRHRWIRSHAGSWRADACDPASGSGGRRSPADRGGVVGRALVGRTRHALDCRAR